MPTVELEDFTDGLRKLPRENGSEGIIDIVFIHGLGGGALTTWQENENDLETFWPNWIKEDLPSCNIWICGYPTSISGWIEQSMPIPDRGTQLLDLFEIKGIGERPFLIIAHSMGGIVAKQLLRSAQGYVNKSWKKISQNVLGIAFISTPHSGSSLANFANFARIILNTNEDVEDLQKHSPHLNDLHQWFREFHTQESLKCITYYEKRPVRIKKIRLSKRLIVVDASSAEPNLGGEVAIGLDEDHITICKPKSRDKQLYEGVLSWARKLSSSDQKTDLKPLVLDEQKILNNWDTTLSQPRDVSLAHLPATERFLFGRELQLDRLDQCWNSSSVNVVSIIASGGFGKSALVNSWLDRMAKNNFFDANYVMAWSFYTQGVTDAPVSGDLFIPYALKKLGDPNPDTGDVWERAERLVALIRKQRVLLIIDGLEPLQYPPGPNVGVIRDKGLSAVVRELAGFNAGLCVLTSRLAVTDIQHFKESTYQIELKKLPSKEGRNLLRMYDVVGPDQELELASDEFGGHPLALHLLGSYLRDIEQGDILKRNRVSLLSEDEEKGGHALRVLRSYETWFDKQQDGELSLLRCLGFFDRPVTITLLVEVMVCSASSLSDEGFHQVGDLELRRIVHRLREARLISAADLSSPDVIDTHPLIREYFTAQLKQKFLSSWIEGNSLLRQYYESVAENLPNNSNDMEYLFLAVIHGCRAGEHAYVLDEIYDKRIMRGSQQFAANKLGSLGPIIYTLSHFFEGYNWETPEHSLSVKKKLRVLMESGHYLTETQGYGDKDVGSCYKGAIKILKKDPDKLIEFETILGLIRYYRLRGELIKSKEYTEKALLISRLLKFDSALPILCRAHCTHLFYTGEFKRSLKYAITGASARLAHKDVVENLRLDVNDPGISCAGYASLAYWLTGNYKSADSELKSALKRSDELRHYHTHAVVLLIAAMLAQFQGDGNRAKKYAKSLINLCETNGFFLWLAAGEIIESWAEAKINKTHSLHEVKRIKTRLISWERRGGKLFSPYWNGLLAEVYYRSGKFDEAEAVVSEALTIANYTGEKWWNSELYRLLSLINLQNNQFEKAKENLVNATTIADKQGAKALRYKIDKVKVLL